MKYFKEPLLSFEFFPPKTLEGKKKLIESATFLSNYSPDFFSVTFGAGGSTRQGTLETTKKLKQQTSIPLAPHLSCIGFYRQELIEIIKTYRALGLKKVVALRGDLSNDKTDNNELNRAFELVELIREISGDFFHIAVAAYPECHPQSINTHNDVLNLKRKIEAGANSAITQYFFNIDAYFYFIDECAKQHIFTPIVPGIMPIFQLTQLLQFSSHCGAEIPRWLAKRLESYGQDINAMQAFGIEVIYHLCERLLAGGAPGLHFYTLNHAKLCHKILDLLKMPIKQQTADEHIM